MLSKDFALKIFEAFSIERWNDLVRPFDIIEMDKAAEKMVLAYIIGKFEEQKGNIIDWDWMIYASLFDLLKKIALCDIKSPVQRMIRIEYPEEYKKINEWLLDKYSSIIKDVKLYNLFKNYLNDDKEETLTKRVFRAAHKYSTLREFEMISHVNEPYRLKNIERQLNDDIVDYLDLTGMQKLITKQKPYEFLLVLEQLRFQIRWNQTPRVPKTSVLGHSFFVAVTTLLLEDSDAQFCKKRRYNNFFSALFHDLPEAVTRDIISPVKQATAELPSVVKKIEDEIVRKELCPLMEDFYVDELMYFTSDEFENRIILPGKDKSSSVEVLHVSYKDLNVKFNDEKYSPVDGRLVRLADQIAAFIEAHQSIYYGITSNHLRHGKKNIYMLYEKSDRINGFDISSFLNEFDDFTDN
ncbi:MAG: HD domain-containing protein [Treponema sp.]|nr:HD domain-containing protein [Treponema sp.]